MRPRRTVHRWRRVTVWTVRDVDSQHHPPRNGAEFGPVLAFLGRRARLQLLVCTKLARFEGTSRPESRRSARRGITGITWDERRPANGPSPRTRDQAP